MPKHIYQKINWKDYNKFWNENFYKYVSEINKYFSNKIKNLKNKDNFFKVIFLFFDYFFFSKLSSEKKILFPIKNKNFKNSFLNVLGGGGKKS